VAFTKLDRVAIKVSFVVSKFLTSVGGDSVNLMLAVISNGVAVAFRMVIKALAKRPFPEVLSISPAIEFARSLTEFVLSSGKFISPGVV
jgi:hypothetical protein